MNLNWSNRVIKYVLFVFNLLFVISGIVMIAVGVSVKSYYTDYDIFLNDSYFSLPNLLIATGSLIFFVSFFGCCGAIRESWFMIFIFSILLSLIFILEFSAGIAGYVLRDKTTAFLTEELTASMTKYQFNNKNPNPTTRMWDTVQSGFECCGAKGPEDWMKIPRPTFVPTVSTPTLTPPTSPVNASVTASKTPAPTASPASTSSPNSTLSLPTTVSATTTVVVPQKLIRKRDAVEDLPTDLPASCCKSNPGVSGTIICQLNHTETARYFEEGCVQGFGDYLKDHAVTIGGVGLAIGFIQLFGVIFACHLTRQLKNGFYST